MAFTYDELMDGNTTRERDEDKEGGVKFLDINIEDKCKGKNGLKDEEDGEMKAGGSGVIDDQDGGMQAEEHETPRQDEGISHHMLLEKQDRDMGLVHTLSHTHPCPIHTKHTRTLHKHSLTLPSKQDKTSRMKITLFPSVGRRIFKQSTRVTLETGGESVTMAQVNVPQTLFYNQNVNLVLRSEGKCKISDADGHGVCTCNDICVSKVTEDSASHELNINATENGFSLSDSETDLRSGVDVSQTVSNISDSKSLNQSTGDVSPSDHRVRINAPCSTDHKISINMNDSIQSDPENGNRAPATPDYTVSISSIGRDNDSTYVSQSTSTSMSHMVSNSNVDHISDVKSVPHSASQSISTPTTSMSQTVSVNKISHSVSSSLSNANQYADASTKTSLRQTIHIRLPATVRNSVRAYFRPAHAHIRTHSVMHTQSETYTHTHTHTLPRSQNRPLFMTKLQ